MASYFNKQSNVCEKQVVEPLVNIKEDDKKIVLEAFMSGLERENISIDVTNKELTLTGTQAAEAAVNGYTAVYQERCPLEYRRTFSINIDIDTENISARYQNGVLTVILPKKEKQQAKKIPIQ